MSTLKAKFTINAYAGGWGNIVGNIENQTDLQNELNSIKGGLNDSIVAVDNKYDSITGALNDSIVAVDNKFDSITGALDDKYDSITGTLADSIIAVDNKFDSITGGLDTRVDAIEEVIPSAASDTNQLADKNFVNSSISTNTANFIGSFNSVADLEAYSGTVTNNDYAFVVGTDAEGNTVYDRYKYTDATTPPSWQFEYELNNSSFTAAQWDAINSGITSGNVALIQTALQPNDNVSSLNNDAKYTPNNATGTKATAIGDSSQSTAEGGVAIGYDARANSTYATAVGESTRASNTNTTVIGKAAKATQARAIAIGSGAEANAQDAIAIKGINNTANTFQVYTYNMLDMATGLIPDARLSTNIARTADIPTDVSDLTNTTLADTELSNLSETGDNRLHALKAYSDNGELLKDAEGLADVRKYAHSTFDRSKFTDYGSPIVTNDGIASGFSDTNGIYVPTLKPNTSSWEIGIEQEVTTEGIQATSSTSNFVFFTDGADLGVNVQTYYSNTNYDNFPVFIKCSDDTNINLQCTSTTGQKASVGDVQKFILGYNASTTAYYFKAYKNGQEYASNSVVSNKILKQTASYNTIGFRRTLRGTKNKIDLKTYYVKIDGVPVYSGNQTGIDVIKDNDYTVVGTPAISNDGIASGFSTSNYLSKSLSSLLPASISSVTVSCDFIYKPDASIGNEIYGTAGNNNSPRLHIDIDGKLHFYMNDGSYTQNGTVLPADYNIQDGDKLSTITTFSNEAVDIYLKVNGGAYNHITFTNSAGMSVNFVTALATFYIGHWSGTGYAFGDIDLNSIRVYVNDNDNLIYQPCLKIPYTLSKTRSKVVYDIYRPRVNDMAKQFGFAPYHTLSDTDFTLPQVELYGNIQQTLRQSTVSGVNQNYLYSDRMQIQTGTCTSGVEVTLPKPFSDGNYALTIPYSAKSATAFTPTATGDWIAIGLGNL